MVTGKYIPGSVVERAINAVASVPNRGNVFPGKARNGIMNFNYP